MDPDEALARLRALVARNRDEGGPDPLDDLDEITGVFTGLDEWLSAGGFLPVAWSWRDDRGTQT